MILIINTAIQNRLIVALTGKGTILLQRKRTIRFNESDKLLSLIEKCLQDYNKKKLKGIIVVTGPGSFSALRIGVTVANTLAWGLQIPIVGVRLNEFDSMDDLIRVGEKRLSKIKGFRIVLPYYGKEPNITKPNK